ncbi:MAG TPA: hypothetical protein PKY88_03595 [Anaerohalosphaeraceae bacterium]|nr:hypothetical protein [Anaerohalosphaeraceae bacterium]
MLPKKQIFPLLWISFLSVHPLITFAVEITIGEETLQVSAPDGFTELKSISEEQFAMFEGMLPKSNRLLAVFISQQDAGRLLRGEPAQFREYMTVHSVKELENLTLPKYQFAELRSVLRKEYDTLLQNQEESIDKMTNEAGKALSQRFGAEVNFNVNGVIPLGIDKETASYITMSQIAKYKLSVDGDQTEHTVAGTITVLLIKGKVLYLSVFKTYEEDNDLEWTRSRSKNWLSYVLSANETTWPRSFGVIVPKGTQVDLVTKELLSEEQAEYNLKSHPKASGLDVSLKYPKSWRAEEGIHPHIVQKFTGKAVGGIIPGCMIIVQDLPVWASLLLEGDIGAEVLSESLREMIPPNATYLDGGKTQIDGEPGAWLKCHYQVERAGMRADMYSLMYLLFYNGKMLSIECAVVGVTEDKEIIEDAFASYLPLFQAIGNSVVIHDKWVKPTNEGGGSIMEIAFGEYWWITLIVSAILTWGVGLAPPLLIRFAFLRRPISKGWAIGIVVFFWVINIMFFTAIGSKSETHTALFLVAWASYAILRKGA